MNLAHCDAQTFIKGLPTGSIQCVICDPPFGLGEETFDKHYARDASHVLPGYVSAPKTAESYEAWAKTWIHEIPRVLRENGTLYIVCAWNHVTDVELAIRSAPRPGLTVLNHIIWKYNFGVYTQNKFVTSHYHILRCGVSKATPTFHSRAYFDESEKLADGKSAQYADMEDVWTIQREYAPGLKKNVNKLPDKLVEKMILYSTDPGDVVADFFMGNFTTAYVAKRTGRQITGCDLNPEACREHIPRVNATGPTGPPATPKESKRPPRAGEPITDAERKRIHERFGQLIQNGTKKDALAVLTQEFGRGYFSLVNILKSARPATERP